MMITLDDVDVFVMVVVMMEAKMYSLPWLRGRAVERRSLAGVLSLSCARPVACG